MEKGAITILSSGVTLGIYVPALTINSQLQNKGFKTDVIVLESLFLKEKQDKIPEAKVAFHKNFKFALMGQKVTGNIFDSFDITLLESTLAKWKNEKRSHFLIFSGFWVPIIEQYISNIDFKIEVDICHMDATESISWKGRDTSHSCYRHIWMFNWENRVVSSIIDIQGEPPLIFEKRKDRFIVHGGGWGIGTYKNVIPELTELGYGLDIIAYENNDFSSNTSNNCYFMIDPNWRAWDKDKDGYYIFPPLGEIKANTLINYKNNRQYSEVYNLIGQCKAIISKPGGATIIDSLSSATPIIFLDPFGEYENVNSKLWEYLGFGISYKNWKESNFSMEILNELHNNLLKVRPKLKNYLEEIYAA